jgi:hypothetical protein
MSPQRGGWEAITPMLGDEDPDDCNPWTKDELTVAFIAVGFLVVLVLDFFEITKVFQ